MSSAVPGVSCKVWNLERYARLISSEKCPDPGSSDWEYFNNEGGQLQLTTVSTNQLLIHHGRKQLESLSLSDAGACLKGISRGDSLMVISKINNQSRRFRVKFAATEVVSAETRCQECVNRLAKHFPIKIPGHPLTDQSQVSSTPQDTPADKQTLTGDITIGQLAEAIVKPSATCLPSVYNELANDSSIDLTTIIKLCLTDPLFPAFVGQVEEEMKKITSDLPS